ncbi:hypothetical protein HAX54_025984, partial [Datura stramonium]|nr:hypothetical protein [Datura stramonium]
MAFICNHPQASKQSPSLIPTGLKNNGYRRTTCANVELIQNPLAHGCNKPANRESTLVKLS